MFIDKLAIAVNANTAQELHEFDAGVHAMLLEREQNGHVKVVETPDEKYIIFLWDHESVDTVPYVKMHEYLNTRRHALVDVRDDGSVFTRVDCSDEFGTDEVFDDILGVKAEITLWNDWDNVIV